MKAYYANQDAVVTFSLIRGDSEPLSPDNNTVTFTVRDVTGATLLTDTTSPIVGTNLVQIIVPAANNNKTLDYEQRYVEISYTSDGYPYTDQLAYNLIEWLPISANADDVRRLIGLYREELPDDRIDILTAYYAITEETQLDLVDLIQAGTYDTILVNRAIALRAAIAVIPSLQLLVLQTEQADNIVAKRFTSVDFDRIEAALIDKYNEALGIITGILGDEIEASLLQVSQGVDVITGA